MYLYVFLCFLVLDETRVVCYIRCFTKFWYIVVEVEYPKGVSALRLKKELEVLLREVLVTAQVTKS